MPKLDVAGRIWGAISLLGKISVPCWKGPTAQSSVWGQCPGFGADLTPVCCVVRGSVSRGVTSSRQRGEENSSRVVAGKKGLAWLWGRVGAHRDEPDAIGSTCGDTIKQQRIAAAAFSLV